MAISIQIGQAGNPGISNVVKSSYCRAAIILTCSLVEGMVYQLVKAETSANKNIIGRTKKIKELHLIPESIFGKRKIVICEKVTSHTQIDQKGVTFERLNIFLRKNKTITETEFKLLDYVRKERNKLHLQGLNVKDVGYTRDKVIAVSKPVDFLSEKLLKFYSLKLQRSKNHS